MKVDRSARLMTAVLIAWCGSALAVDCPVNPLEAHNVAKLRGWAFSCNTVSTQGVVAGFVTYPPAAIGCTFKTPLVLGGVTFLGNGQFFRNGAIPGARPDLKNGWRVKTYEIIGGQWSQRYGNPGARVAWDSQEVPKPNRTYNFMLNKLVLSHPSSTCAEALDEAF